MRRLAVLLLVFTCVPLWPAPKPSSQIIVFTNVNVVDTRGGTILPNLTVVVSNRRIAGIAKVGLIAGGPNVQIINGHGMYLMPGLWDMDVHTGRAPLWDENVLYPLYIANGVTGVRDLGGDLDLLEHRRQRIEAKELIGPHIISAGPSLSSQTSSPETFAVHNPTEARDAVARLKARGVNLVTVHADLERESYFALADETTKEKIPLAGIVPDSVTAVEASDAGQRSIERLAGIMLACSSQEYELRHAGLEALARQDRKSYAAIAAQASTTYDSKKAWDMFVQFTSNNTWQVPSLVWSQAAAARPPATDPRLKYVPASIRQEWEMSTRVPEPDLDAMKKQADREIELVNAMRRGGVQFMAGTNGPDPYVLPGFSLHAELERLVQSGFTPQQALRAATFNSALFLAKLDQFGVVEVGHAADLVLLEANPFDDIRNTRKIAAVVASGRYFSRPQLDRMLAQVAKLAAQE